LCKRARAQNELQNTKECEPYRQRHLRMLHNFRSWGIETVMRGMVNGTIAANRRSGSFATDANDPGVAPCQEWPKADVTVKKLGWWRSCALSRAVIPVLCDGGNA